MAQRDSVLNICGKKLCSHQVMVERCWESDLNTLHCLSAPTSHAYAAVLKGAGVYATSVLISENGYARDSEILQSYAKEHSMGVLMANHGGPSGGWACAGRSAFWSPGGDLVASASGTGDCLVIARRRQGVWQGQVVEVSLHSVLPAL